MKSQIFILERQMKKVPMKVVFLEAKNLEQEYIPNHESPSSEDENSHSTPQTEGVKIKCY